MTTYTTPDSLPIIEPTADRIKDGAEVSALAGDISALATATQAALVARAVTADADATTKANAAQTAAATDATTKANAAQTAAINDATTKYGGLPAHVNEVETTLQNRVPTADPRLPSQITGEDIAAIVDLFGRDTWLGARGKDGGPTDHSERMIRDRLGLLIGIPGYIAAIVDDDRGMTDLAVRSLDGQIPDWVMRRWGSRIAALVPQHDLVGGVLYTLDPVTGKRYPSRVDYTKSYGFGSSTMANIGPYFGPVSSSHGVGYFNRGKGGEIVEQTLARFGSRPALLNAFTIPASGPVAVTSSNVTTSANSGTTATGTVGGIVGTLSNNQGAGNDFTFTRTTAGAATPIPAGTPFLPNHGLEGGIAHLNLGKNNFGGLGGATNPELIFRWTVEAAAYNGSANVLVWGHFNDTNESPSTFARRWINKYNKLAKEHFGPRYFDLGAYVTGSQIWADTGITPTTEDLTQQAAGNKPPSLSNDNLHLNAAGYEAVTAKVHQQLITLGWIN